MAETPLMLAAYPRAILHVDGDAFFASVEQALVPAYRGRPLVTGQERGIIACASYEAKACGISRGMPLGEARRRCPELIVLPSDYETYGLYSQRMFNVLRRFTPMVEEYSIDEGFADLTGLRRVFRTSYEKLAAAVQKEIHRDLGITVSVGLAPTKTLAKLCSKFRKPAGLTAVPGPEIHRFLGSITLAEVWGFGPNTVALLSKLGLRTALDFVRRPQSWAGRLLGKVGRELWSELRGVAVHPVVMAPSTPRTTIVRSKTFVPPSTDRAFVYAQLVQNAELAFARARRFRLRPRWIGIALRRQDFRHDGLEATLSRATSATLEVMPLLEAMFAQVFQEGVEYRATLICLGRLEDDRAEQGELFADRIRLEKLRRITAAVDAINSAYGRLTVRSGAGLFLQGRARGPREAAPTRWQASAPSGTAPGRGLGIPRMTLSV